MQIIKENVGQESFYGKFKFELGNLNRFNSIEEAIEAVHLQIYYYLGFTKKYFIF